MIISKTEFVRLFETKIRLNEAIANKGFNKEDFEYVLIHILKSNLYLKKHYNKLFKKYTDDLLDECNELLEWDFFVNDNVLMIWIARALNKVARENRLQLELKSYLTKKSKSMKDKRWGFNKYDDKINERTSIYCDDDCFIKYLPNHKSKDYYGYEENVDILYPQFDYELSMYKKNLNKDELDNIKEFRFRNIREKELLKWIDKYRISFHEIKNDKYSRSVEIDLNVLEYIRCFENILIFANNKYNFGNYISSEDIFELMKNDMFNYSINDDYFIVDIGDGDSIHYSKKIEVKSLMDFTNLIDFPKWIKYMNSHDIGSLEAMYVDKLYDEFKYI